jgi:hypothetical protein
VRLLLVIDVPSVSEPHDNHQEHVVLDRVDDAVVTDPNTKPEPTLQRSRTGWSRVLCEQGDRSLHATTDLRVELA